MRMMRIANMQYIVYPKTSYKITGILFKVHNELGRMCNEKQYADAIEKQFNTNSIVFGREKVIPISFDGEQARRNIADFIIENKIILEVKAKRFLTREDYYQTRRYLQAMQLKLGVLVNFREKYLRPRRILNSSVSHSQFAD